MGISSGLIVKFWIFFNNNYNEKKRSSKQNLAVYKVSIPNIW